MSTKITLKDLADRPRERLIKEGASKLSNSDLLAIIISSGTKEENAIDLAKNVLSLEKDNLSYLSNYAPEEFQQIKGIGRATACKICASIELGKRINSSSSNKIHLGDPSEVAKYFEDLRHLNYETMKIALFNAKLELIKVCEISIGGISYANFDARSLFAPAIRAGAFGIIMVHNHPSGNPTPSASDVQTTKNILEAGKLLGIKLMDHIIIGDGTYCSMREESLVEFI